MYVWVQCVCVFEFMLTVCLNLVSNCIFCILVHLLMSLIKNKSDLQGIFLYFSFPVLNFSQHLIFFEADKFLHSLSTTIIFRIIYTPKRLLIKKKDFSNPDIYITHNTIVDKGGGMLEKK